MTLQEAIKSGKPFRLKGCNFNTYFKCKGDRIVDAKSGAEVSLSLSTHLVLGEWEVLEPRLALSATDIRNAIVKEEYFSQRMVSVDAINKVLHNLGFNIDESILPNNYE